MKKKSQKSDERWRFMETRQLPIGIDNFKEIVNGKYYYVDKTGLISDLLGNMGKVNLFTRPRRFGKSLNMSMLKCFFLKLTRIKIFLMV